MAGFLQGEDGDVVGLPKMAEGIPVGVEAGDIEADEVHDVRAVAVSRGGEASQPGGRNRMMGTTSRTTAWWPFRRGRVHPGA